MLVELNISNYAVIDSLRLPLGPGFNVLTGETGAGKSIILDALGLLLGDRADATMVRSGEERAVIEGIFELPEDLQTALARIADVDLSSDSLILAREVSANGRSVCRINGRAVPQRKLAEVGMVIVDIHGQGEHLSLLRPSEHLELLDRYGGLTRLRSDFAAVASELQSVRGQIARINRERAELDARSELLTFQTAEIAAAELRVGEDEALGAERTLLLNAESATQLARDTVGVLEQDHPAQAGAIELINRAVRSLAGLERFEPAFQTQRKVAESAVLDLVEVVRELNTFADGLEPDENRLQQIQERLDAISSLKRKYGSDIGLILQFQQKAAGELEAHGRSSEMLEGLAAEEARLVGRACELAGELSASRAQAAGELTAEVEEQLAGLGMEGARLAVAFDHQPDPSGLPSAEVGTRVFGGRVDSGSATPSEDGLPDLLRFDATGVDRVEFLIAANKGESLKPLASTASGGETSRLMLAIKGALVKADPIPTLVFDEIDAGIGGRVGEAVGRRLWTLGRAHQVLAVTHLPQIASCGDLHIAVAKEQKGDRMSTTAVPVRGEERLAAITGMLGSDTPATRQKAAELLDRSGPRL